MELELTVYYKTPSLNVTKRQHWAVQMQEKHRAFRALLSALRDTASGLSTPTTSPEAARIFSTASDTLGLYLATSHGQSGLKQTKKKYLTDLTSEQWLELLLPDGDKSSP
jgi:hypothetical protein